MKLATLSMVGLAAFAADSAPGAAQLGWMPGCWSVTKGSLTIEEHWSTPAGGSLLGWNRTLKAGKLVFHEFMRIEQTGGTTVYHARIGPNSAGTPFTLKEAGPDSAIFENPAHDFPQRLVYRRTSEGLHARIEGVSKGKQRAEDFPYKRVSCE